MTIVCSESNSIQSGVSIVDVVRNEDIAINETPKGGRFRCPFHFDKHPSAFAYRESNRFVCFGCGARGDAIDFIMKLKEMSFREATAYLGIERGREVRIHRRTNEKWKQKQVLLKAFRQWEGKYYDELALIYRVSHQLMSRFKMIEEVEDFAPLYHEIPLIEHMMDILLFGSDEDKYRLYKEVTGELRSW